MIVATGRGLPAVSVQFTFWTTPELGNSYGAAVQFMAEMMTKDHLIFWRAKKIIEKC